MKKVFETILILLTLCISLGSCKKDDDTDGSPEDSLAEYFYCKINGEVFNPTSTFSCNSRLFGYYPEAGDGIEAGYLVISGTKCPSYEETVALRFSGFIPHIGETDLLLPTQIDSCFPILASFSPIESYYDSLISGSVNFIKFRPRILPDGELSLVEGTFEFTVANSETDSIVEITEGYFRFRTEQSW